MTASQKMSWKCFLLFTAHNSAVGKSLVSPLSDSSRGTTQSCLEVSSLRKSEVRICFYNRWLSFASQLTSVLARSFRSDNSWAMTPKWSVNPYSLSSCLFFHIKLYFFIVCHYPHTYWCQIYWLKTTPFFFSQEHMDGIHTRAWMLFSFLLSWMHLVGWLWTFDPLASTFGVLRLYP